MWKPFYRMEKVLTCVLQEQDHLRLKREWQQDTSKLTVGKCILGLEAGPGVGDAGYPLVSCKRPVLAGRGCFQYLHLSLRELGPSTKQKAPKAFCLC